MDAPRLYLKVDSQILSVMNLCPERYNLEMIQNWRPLEKPKALERGSVMHTMVAAYRREKKKGFDREKHAAVVKHCVLLGRQAAAATRNIDSKEFEEEDLRTFHDYVLKWQYDGWEILDVEQPFSKVLFEDDSFGVVLAGQLYQGLTIIYEGVIDARVVDPKLGQLIVDSKTESRKSYPYILSNQFQGYEWAFGVPVLVDKIGYQSSLPSNEKFRRLLHDSGSFAVQEWVEDSVAIIKEAIGWHQTLERGGRLIKNRTSCDKYSGCIFQSVCKVPAEVRIYKLQARFFKDKPWDPYTRDADEDEF